MSASGIPDDRSSLGRQLLAGVMFLWMCGGLICLTRLAVSCIALRRLRINSELLAGGPLCELLETIRQRLQIGGKVALLLGDKQTTPMAWGVLRSYVFLPKDAIAWSHERLNAVLIHELGHIKRRDPLTQVLVQFACAIHWFNPVVWFAAWQIRVERERACDDLVVNSGIKAEDYAEHLLRIVSGFEGRGLAGMSGLTMASKGRLEGRLCTLLNSKTNRRAPTRSTLMTTAAAILTLSIPLAMLRAVEQRDGAGREKESAETTGDKVPSREIDAADQVLILTPEGKVARPPKPPQREDKSTQKISDRVKRLVESADMPASTDKRLKVIRAEFAKITRDLTVQERQAIRTTFVTNTLSYLDAENRRTRCNAALVLIGLGDKRGLGAIIKELEDRTPRPTEMIRSDGSPNVEGQVTSD